MTSWLLQSDPFILLLTMLEWWHWKLFHIFWVFVTFNSNKASSNLIYDTIMGHIILLQQAQSTVSSANLLLWFSISLRQFLVYRMYRRGERIQPLKLKLVHRNVHSLSLSEICPWGNVRSSQASVPKGEAVLRRWEVHKKQSGVVLTAL